MLTGVFLGVKESFSSPTLDLLESAPKGNQERDSLCPESYYPTVPLKL